MTEPGNSDEQRRFGDRLPGRAGPAADRLRGWAQRLDLSRAQAARPASQADPTPDEPPTLVKVSFWLWIAAGLVLVAGFGLTLSAKEQLIQALIQLNNDPNISDEQLRQGATSLLWTLFIGAVAFAILFALFAYRAREGIRSARTILTVLAAISLIFQVVLFSNLVTLVSALLAVVALVLLYLPSVADYFPKTPRSRLAP